ncbi:MAG: glycoside hydrolase family 113 [Thermoleophilia bacterium]
MRSVLAATLLTMGVIAILLAGLPAGNAGVPGLVPEPARAQTAPVQPQISFSIRGFNLPSWQSNQYAGPAAAGALGDVAATGANWVAIDPTQYVSNVHSVTIGPDPGGRTATDAAVAAAIDQAHALGLKVMLKPHVDVEDGSCRCDIAPTDPAAWFASYNAMIDDYARLAQAHHVELLAVGTELTDISGAGYYQLWQQVVAGVRSIYSGPLTYASGQDEYQSLSFWGLLDYMGVDVYLPLSDAAQPTSSQLISGWTAYSGRYGSYNWLDQLTRWQAQWHKPVIFTELGYRSVRYAASSPWDYSFAGTYDGELQARAADAALRVFNNQPWLAGIFWWDWMIGGDTGGQGNTDYTVQGKPAQATLTSWYSSAAPQLGVTAASISWGSLDNYQQGRLNVAFNVVNNGNGTAYRARVVSIDASGGSTAAGFVPVTLGDLPSGSSASLTVVYHVPAGTLAFKTLVTLTCVDASGQLLGFSR